MNAQIKNITIYHTIPMLLGILISDECQNFKTMQQLLQDTTNNISKEAIQAGLKTSS